ncbi:hypothetical protein CDAR_101861 [Caerostris darwini]|uniref:Uncharacterized protein n=1 Tax=Caerostris darwini TaxID=1538125 RepID=A0AAV4TDN8_9ARAC|nr:hypothetical protein CDAR_101861 [Caerostris darwini]
MLSTWFTLWYSVLKHSKVPSPSENAHVRTVSNEKSFPSAVTKPVSGWPLISGRSFPRLSSGLLFSLQEYSAGVSPAFDAVANGFPDSGSCFSGILKWVSQ